MNKMSRLLETPLFSPMIRRKKCMSGFMVGWVCVGVNDYGVCVCKDKGAIYPSV